MQIVKNMKGGDQSMGNKSKTLSAVGYTWVVLASVFILYRYIVVLVGSGAPFVSKLLSFINFWNIIFSLLVLMPGLICILAADNIRKKKNSGGEK
jgi:hypothetical protein